MKRRTYAALGAALPLAAGLLFVGTPSATAGFPGNWCSDNPTPPCISAATRDGTPITSANTTWDVYVSAPDLQWNVEDNTGDAIDLGADEATHTWSITIDAGTLVPRVAHQYADDVTVQRIDDGDGTWHVRITGNPVTFLNNPDCDTSTWPWTCPETASSERTLLQGTVTPYNEWTDVEQRKAMFGMNYSTNVEVTSIPPEITYDDATNSYYLLIRMANSHFHPNGTTVFKGFAHLRIPNQFLRVAYGVDDPSTMTSSGLVTTGAGGATVSISQEAGADAMHVDLSDITFSSHLVKIKRGVITPTRPRSPKGARTGAHRAKISFTKAKARGSKITGYKVACTSSTGSHHVSATGTGSPILVTGLKAHRGYDCRVRAKSKAGLGTRSVRFHVAHDPPSLPSTG